MTVKHFVRTALILLVLGVFATTLSAQKAEIYPYAGGFWPDKTPRGQLQTDGIYGIKAGGFLDEHFQVEGSFGYINHFDLTQDPNPFNAELGITRPPVRGLLWEANGAWNFANRQFANTRVTPYVTLGAGGLTALIKGADQTFIAGGGLVLDPDTDTFVPNPARSIVMEDRDTFFMFSYGGGVKAMNVWGPLGLRADVRGRTLPNFFGKATNWPEVTGGVIFSWGER